jgi:hypothetical protein
LPEPLLPLVILNQLIPLFVAVQGATGLVVTVTVPVVADASTDTLVGLIE